MKKRLFTIIAAIAACGIVFASCEKKAENVAVSSVTLGEPSLTLAPAATATLSYEVLPAEATNKNVTWESSNNNVATVADGVVTAVGVGETIITVRTEDMNKTATCTVTVAVGVTGIALNPSTLDLYIEDTETLAVEFTPAEATNKNVTWTSSQTAIATVADGVVTAVAPGEAVITATTEDGGKTATCTVTVRQSLPTFEDYFGSYRLTGDVAPNGMFGESTRWSQDHGDDPFSGEDVMIKDASDVNPNIFESREILVIDKVMQYPWPTSGFHLPLEFDYETRTLKNIQVSVDGAAVQPIFVYETSQFNFTIIPSGTFTVQMNEDGEIIFPETLNIDGVDRTIYFMHATISQGTNVNPFSEDMICKIKLVKND